MCLSVRESDLKHLEDNREQYEGKLYYKVIRIWEEKNFRDFMRECCGKNRRGFRNFIKNPDSANIIRQILPRHLDKFILIQIFCPYRSKTWNIGRAYVDSPNAILPTRIIQPDMPDKLVRYHLGYHAYRPLYFEKISRQMLLWKIGQEYPLVIGYFKCYDYFWIVVPVLLSDITAVGRHFDCRSNERYCVVGRNMLVLGQDDYDRYQNRDVVEIKKSTDNAIRQNLKNEPK